MSWLLQWVWEVAACLLVEGLLGHLADHAGSHGLGSRQVLVPEQALQLRLGSRLPLLGSRDEPLLKRCEVERGRPIALAPLHLLQHSCCCSCLHAREDV